MSRAGSDDATEQVHGTCVMIDDVGVLITGPSGSGKSDLALRLMEGGAQLVADDRVDLTLRQGQVIARAPLPLRGLLEAREVGILKFRSVEQAAIRAVISLNSSVVAERLPSEKSTILAGVEVRCFLIDPWQQSAPAKVRLVSQLVSGSIVRIDD